MEGIVNLQGFTVQYMSILSLLALESFMKPEFLLFYSPCLHLFSSVWLPLDTLPVLGIYEFAVRQRCASTHVVQQGREKGERKGKAGVGEQPSPDAGRVMSSIKQLCL